MDEDEQVVTHERMGSTTPSAGRPTPYPRNYEFRDNTLILSPPGRTVDGEEVRSYLAWERLSKEGQTGVHVGYTPTGARQARRTRISA